MWYWRWASYYRHWCVCPALVVLSSVAQVSATQWMYTAIPREDSAGPFLVARGNGGREQGGMLIAGRRMLIASASLTEWPHHLSCCPVKRRAHTPYSAVKFTVNGSSISWRSRDAARLSPANPVAPLASIPSSSQTSSNCPGVASTATLTVSQLPDRV